MGHCPVLSLLAAGDREVDGDWPGVLLQWCLVTSWPSSLTAASVVPVSLGCPQTRAPQGGFLPSLTRASTLLKSSCSFLLGL